VKNLLSTAVDRGDLRILNYNKRFSAGAPSRTPLGELTTLSQTIDSDKEKRRGILPPHSPPLSPLVLLLN